MTANMKRILYLLLGLYAGAISWGLQEWLLDGFIGSYLILNLLHGASTGLIFGFLLGTAEGISISNKKKALVSGGIGALLGLVAGLLSFFLAALVLTLLTGIYSMDQQQSYALILPIARAMGWALVGVLIGVTEGLRTLSFTRLLIGFFGGLLGGLLGGAVLEASLRFFEVGIIGRIIGFLFLGLSLGFWLGDFEARFAFGRLKVLTGPLKNKEYLLSRKTTRIGSSYFCDILLGEYSGVAEVHSLVHKTKSAIHLSSKDEKSPILVNEQILNQDLELKYEDVIQIGKAKLLLLPL